MEASSAETKRLSVKGPQRSKSSSMRSSSSDCEAKDHRMSEKMNNRMKKWTRVFEHKKSRRAEGESPEEDRKLASHGAEDPPSPSPFQSTIEVRRPPPLAQSFGLGSSSPAGTIWYSKEKIHSQPRGPQNRGRSHSHSNSPHRSETPIKLTIIDGTDLDAPFSSETTSPYIHVEPMDKFLTLNEILSHFSNQPAHKEGSIRLLFLYRKLESTVGLLGRIHKLFLKIDGALQHTRYLFLLKVWLTSFPNDFVGAVEAHDKMANFLDFVDLAYPAYKSKVVLLKHLLKGIAPLKQELSDGFLEPETKLIHQLDIFTVDELSIHDFDTIELCRQMTHMDFELFFNIQLEELMVFPWSNTKYGSTPSPPPSVSPFILHFNHIHYLFKFLLLMEISTKKRVKILQKLLDMADHLYQLNNFNGVLQIVSVLQHKSIERLQKTLARLPIHHQEMMRKLLDVCDSSDNFSKLREIFLSTDTPLIPYIGIHFTSLWYIDTTMQDALDDKFNYEKLDAMSKILHDLKHLQRFPYRFGNIPVIQKWLGRELPIFTDEQLLSLSYKHEPPSGAIPVLSPELLAVIQKRNSFKKSRQSKLAELKEMSFLDSNIPHSRPRAASLNENPPLLTRGIETSIRGKRTSPSKPNIEISSPQLVAVSANELDALEESVSVAFKQLELQIENTKAYVFEEIKKTREKLQTSHKLEDQSDLKLAFEQALKEISELKDQNAYLRSSVVQNRDPMNEEKHVDFRLNLPDSLRTSQGPVIISPKKSHQAHRTPTKK